MLYLVRPYEPKDEKDVYALAAKLFEEEIEVPMGKQKYLFHVHSWPEKLKKARPKKKLVKSVKMSIHFI